MRLTFLGTRGNIRMANRSHRRHAAMLAEAGGVRLLLDAGADWRGELDALAPDAILVTHAHGDHAGGLRDGAPCPVYATEETQARIPRAPIDRIILESSVPRSLGSITFVALAVEHSLLAPAVGYRLDAEGASLFYVPDVLALIDAGAALHGIDLYIGDGATYGRPIVRRKDGRAFGHETIETQLDWCASEGVRRAVFTHCGSRIVRARQQEIAEKVSRFGTDRGITATVAVDDQVIELPEGARVG